MSLDPNFDPFADFETLAYREIFASRVIEAPLKPVYAAFSDPDQLVRWWGPKGSTCVLEEFDLRDRGKWRYTIRDSEGISTSIEYVFVYVVPEVMVSVRYESSPQYQLGIAFAEQAAQTVVCVSQVFNSLPEHEQFSDTMFRMIEESLERLAQLLGEKKN